MPTPSDQLWAAPACWEPESRGATLCWQDLGQLFRGLPFGPWGPDTACGSLHVTHDGVEVGAQAVDLRYSILRPVPSSATHSFFGCLSSFLQTVIPFSSSVGFRWVLLPTPASPECPLWLWQLADGL